MKDQKMNNIKLNNIRNKYSNSGFDKLLIVGFNDSQGVDTSFKLNKKSFLYYIEKELKLYNIKYQAIDCYSLLFNKTYYIDSFLKHNIDLKDIRLLQIYGNIMALRKSMNDYHLPKFISQIRNIYRFIYKKNSNNLKIRNQLIHSTQPIIIYSSGANDLMRLIGTDPLSIISHYKNREKTQNFNYSVNQAKDLDNVSTVIKNIEDNLKSIYYYNSSSICIVLGSYIPFSLQNDKMKIFTNLIEYYNNSLKNLCKKYNAVYIDTHEIGLKYNKSKFNFHISTKGHKELSKIILYNINDKILNSRENLIENFKINVDDNGLTGILYDINTLFQKCKEKKIESFRYEEIINEYLNEIEILNYVKNKSNSLSDN